MSATYRSRSWSDEERETVKGLLAKGASAGAVANAMGCNRNQAIGRIHRDPGLHLNSYAARALTKKVKLQRQAKLSTLIGTSQPARDVVKKIAKAGTPVCVAAEPVPVEPVPDEPEYLNTKVLADTGAHFCKWPILWDTSAIGNWICCGEPTTNLDPFCRYHRFLSKRRKHHG